jgi:para-nitrobenzyl esterase
MYDGANLAERGGVVVVSVNHRLNLFGYAWFGDLVPDLADHANPGQRDIEMALRWVRENIGAFGGDPGNVTVFGESGGGGKIGALCASPSASGLFHKMVVMSGATTWVQDRNQATELATKLLDEGGVTIASASELCSVSAQRWKAAAAAVEAQLGTLAFQPVVDGAHIIDPPWSEAALRAADLPLMIGTTTEETSAFLPQLADGEPTEDELVRHLRSFRLAPPLDDEGWRRVIDRYRRTAPGMTRAKLMVAITTDLSFWGSTRSVLERRAAVCSSATYAYDFAWETPCYGAKWSPHAVELPFLFGNLDYGTAWDGSDTDELRAGDDPAGERYPLSDEMIAAWAAFARHGDPATSQLPWPSWSAPDLPTMVFQRGGSEVVNHHKDSRWDIVRSLPRGS